MWNIQCWTPHFRYVLSVKSKHEVIRVLVNLFITRVLRAGHLYDIVNFSYFFPFKPLYHFQHYLNRLFRVFFLLPVKSGPCFVICHWLTFVVLWIFKKSLQRFSRKYWSEWTFNNHFMSNLSMKMLWYFIAVIRIFLLQKCAGVKGIIWNFINKQQKFHSLP